MINVSKSEVKSIANLETAAAAHTHTHTLCLLNLDKIKNIIINKRE